MDKQNSSSKESSTVKPIILMVIIFTLLIGGCQELEQNGTFDRLADELESPA